MKPSIGRIVHYVNFDGAHLAALVNRVWTNVCVNLTVFLNGSQEGTSDDLIVSRTSIVEDPTGKSTNSWHWPERE